MHPPFLPNLHVHCIYIYTGTCTCIDSDTDDLEPTHKFTVEILTTNIVLDTIKTYVQT